MTRTSPAPVFKTTDELLTPARCWSPREEVWYRHHVPVLARWLDEEFPETDLSFQVASFACSSLIDAPVSRAIGPSEYGFVREPYCWDEMGAFELIEESLRYGVMPGWDYEFLLSCLQRAAQRLVEKGLIASPHGEKLLASLAEYIPGAIGRWNSSQGSRS